MARAEPKNTTVSATSNSAKRDNGSRYSARMRTARASLAFKNPSFR
jgi:hypothetical protein